MGADLIIYRCSAPSNLGLSNEEGKARLKEYVLSATVRLLDAYFDEFESVRSLQEAYEEEVGSGDLEHISRAHEEGASADPVLDWGREHFWQRLETAYKETVESPGSRDLSSLSFAGVTYMLSGGMSWGDEPTEAGPHLRLLDWTGVFDPSGSDGELLKRVLDLSTAHVPCEKLERNVLDLDVHWRCQYHEHGWIVFLGDTDSDSEAPEWFRPILKLARALDCSFVNFDQDGPTTDLLPLYTETPE